MNRIFDTNIIVIFDMEVLSFDLDHKVLVQFSARRFKNNEMTHKLDILINEPYIKLNEDFVKRTRITKKLLATKGISYQEALEKIYHFIGNDTLVTYKGNFYYLHLLWNMFDNKLKNPTIDIIDIAQDLNIIHGNPDKISLEDIANSLNISFNNQRWHNASYDVSIIEKIWFKIKSIVRKVGEYEQEDY